MLRRKKPTIIEERKDRTVSPAKRNTVRKARGGRMGADEIRRLIEARAYEIYCHRDQWAGDSIGDWLVAEQQVKAELSISE